MRTPLVAGLGLVMGLSSYVRSAPVCVMRVMASDTPNGARLRDHYRRVAPKSRVVDVLEEMAMEADHAPEGPPRGGGGARSREAAEHTKPDDDLFGCSPRRRSGDVPTDKASAGDDGLSDYFASDAEHEHEEFSTDEYFAKHGGDRGDSRPAHDVDAHDDHGHDDHGSHEFEHGHAEPDHHESDDSGRFSHSAAPRGERGYEPRRRLPSYRRRQEERAGRSGAAGRGGGGWDDHRHSEHEDPYGSHGRHSDDDRYSGGYSDRYGDGDRYADRGVRT